MNLCQDYCLFEDIILLILYVYHSDEFSLENTDILQVVLMMEQVLLNFLNALNFI